MTLSRPQVLDALTRQLPAQFEALLFRFSMPSALVRRNATQTEQAIDLIHYAESQGRLAELAALLAAPSASGAVFQQGGQSVGHQINVAGDVHIQGDFVGGDKIVQTVTGNGNVFSGAGNVRIDKK